MTDNSHDYIVLTHPPDAEMLERWENFLCNSTFATHYVTPDFFSDPFVGAGERFVVLVTCKGQIDAVLSGLRQGRSISCGLTVRPQAAFRNGVDRASAASALIAGLAEFDGSAEVVKLYSWDPIDGIDQFGYEHELCSGADQVVMLDLSKGADELFKEFSERRRTDLRKTIKLGKIAVKQLETEAELGELFTIHKDWNQRKGTQPEGFDAFKQMLSSEYRATFIALFEGKIIAATYLRFCNGGVVEYAANNSLEEFQKLRPNELLGWWAIGWACSAGFKHFSLGACHPFLARFGGNVVAAHRYRLDRTLFRRHKNRERVSRIAVNAYLSLPDSVRRRLKTAAARV
ncbi:MAG: GNAT family N-acetyltransferase [Chloracidobacterium sp.]|nr:GNAT family N-acetyltransferase [Chloracidobacterium sp.]